MILVFTIATLALVFGQQVLNFLGPIFQLPLNEISKIFSYRYPVLILVMMLALWYLNYVLPNIKRQKESNLARSFCNCCRLVSPIISF